MRSAKVSADDPSVALRAPAPVVPKAWPPPTKRRWRLGRRSWYPKYFARMRSQYFDHCHSFLRAFSATGGAPQTSPFPQGSLGLTALKTPAAGAALRPGGSAGTSNRSRQPTGDSSSPVPRGKAQEGGTPSWFPAQAGKNPDHFSRRHVRREKYSSRSEVSGPPWRARPSGVPSPPAGTPGLARGNGSAISTKRLTERSVDQRPPLGGLWSAPEHSALPSSQRPKGAETGPPRPNVPRYIWAKLNFSQRTSFSPSGSSTFNGMTALETLMRWM